MPNDVQVHQIPFGAIVSVTGMDNPDEQATFASELATAAQHDRFVLVFLPAEGGAQVMGNDEILTALRATQADEVSDELTTRAVDAAQIVANDVAQSVTDQRLDTAAADIAEKAQEILDQEGK